MLQLTCMGVEDLSEVMVLERAGHDFPWSEGIMASCLSRHHHARLLYEDQVLVGFAILQQVLDEASLLNMVIAAAARRRGHAVGCSRASSPRCMIRSRSSTSRCAHPISPPSPSTRAWVSMNTHVARAIIRVVAEAMKTPS